MAYDWTDERIATLKRMRKESASSVTIARTLGGVSAKVVGRKIRELGLAGNFRWPEQKIEELRAGYEAGLTPTLIAKKLGASYTAKSVKIKASEIGIARRTEWTERQEAVFSLLHDAGLPQRDILGHLSHLPDGQVRHRIARRREEHAPLTTEQRDALRQECLDVVLRMVRDATAEEGVWLGAWIIAVAPQIGRDLREIARVCLLPVSFVERIFALLDQYGFWPVTQRQAPAFDAGTCARISFLCSENVELVDIEAWHEAIGTPQDLRKPVA